MPLPAKLLALCACLAAPLAAQLPFYTDDPAVTARGKFHFEFFNEFDALQHQDPNIRQNTTNYKLNYGLPHNLELDLDFPYLAIFRLLETPDSHGAGDVNLGVKWNFHKASSSSRVPALSASLYIEFPTGDARQQLGSGLVDYVFTVIAQKPITSHTRINSNLGYVLAGNTSTGALGIQSSHGHVFTGGLSALHDFNARLTLGVEVYGAFSSRGSLGRSQLQAMIGGQFALRRGMALDFGLLGGKYVASPRVGAQVGFSLDFPDLYRPVH
ncbi:MAG: transporter [Candidatus Solibacter usitatus]|nr:transporter [Candidatus Solibacter usitatus]